MPQICSNRTFRRPGSKVSRRKPKVAFPSKYRNRPALIRHAIYNAWVIMEDINLSISGVAVLQAVIALGIDANDPYKLVYAKKGVLAGHAGVSESSVYRTLATLEKHQLIIRYEQQQRVDGSLSVSQLSLTTKLLLLLGFDIDVEGKEESGVDAAEQASDDVINETTDHSIALHVAAATDRVEVDQTCFSNEVIEEGGCAIVQASSGGVRDQFEDDLTGLQDDAKTWFAETDQPTFLGDLTDGLSDGLTGATYIEKQKVDRREDPKTTPSVDNQSTGAAKVKIGKFSVPVELSWVILEKRLTCPQLFNLMKMAKKVPGQKIEDFIELRKDRLKTLATTNDCYRFINALINNNIDAKYLVSQRNKQAEKETRAIAIQKAVKIQHGWFESREGQTFVDSKINTSYTINSRNMLLLVGQNGLPDTRSPSVKATQNFIDRVTRGELVRFVPKPCNDRIKDAPKARLTQLWSAVKGGLYAQA